MTQHSIYGIFDWSGARSEARIFENQIERDPSFEPKSRYRPTASPAHAARDDFGDKDNGFNSYAVPLSI